MMAGMITNLFRSSKTTLYPYSNKSTSVSHPIDFSRRLASSFHVLDVVIHEVPCQELEDSGIELVFLDDGSDLAPSFRSTGAGTAMAACRHRIVSTSGLLPLTARYQTFAGSSSA